MRILIAGVGNLLRGDDGFGVRVVHRLERRSLPEGVRVVEVGISGISLVRELTAGYDACVIVDCIDRGAAAGTLFVLETLPEPEPIDIERLRREGIDMHYVEPSRALLLAQALGARPRKAYVVGCQPQNTEELTDKLSDVVDCAAERAVGIVERLIADCTRPVDLY